jgi:hypothetical protein
MLQEDPNEAVIPDFTSDKYQLARQRLVQDSLNDGQAACTLASLWTLENNTAKERWPTGLSGSNVSRTLDNKKNKKRGIVCNWPRTKKRQLT